MNIYLVPGSYIACDNKGPRTGAGGPFCKLEIYRQ